MTTQPPYRIAPVLAPESWELPPKPEGAAHVIQDTDRQTRFQLGNDLRLLHEGMNLQLRIVRDSHPAKYRTHQLAAALMPWSRAFLGISDAALLVLRGSYASSPPLVRAACECIAASTQLRMEEFPAFQEWLRDALRPEEEQKAINVGMGQFFAGSTVAADPRFAAVYRAASELSRPHIGAGLLFTAPESNQQRLAVTFGDQGFHFGWAQLILGWLLALCEVQLRLVRTTGGDVFNLTEAVRTLMDTWKDRVDAALADPKRCTIQPVQVHGDNRLLIHNFRRQATGAPRKYLL